MPSESSIPAEIASLHLPQPTAVVVAGGSAMELYGIRKAGDIDLVVSLNNWQYLRDTLGWKLQRNTDGRTFLTDSSGRFDVWRWWYDASRPQGRISLEELKKHSYQFRDEYAFFIVKPVYLIRLKRMTTRQKDKTDVRLIKKHLQTISLLQK